MYNNKIEFENDLTLKALSFAVQCHNGQYRKYIGIPYVNHCTSVYSILYNYGIRKTDTLIASMLHDVIEDCDIKIEDLMHLFGYEVAKIVLDCTNAFDDPIFGSRQQRKSMESDRLSLCNHVVQNIKIADAIDNCQSILIYDEKFAKIYFKEKFDMAMKFHRCDNDMKNELLKLLSKMEGIYK